jgi:predicted phosphodiesterase
MKRWFLLFSIFLSVISVCSFAANTDNKFNVLAFADIHFDPFTGCLGNRTCPLIDKLRFSSAKEWPRILAMGDAEPQQIKQDTNYRLLTSALNNLQQAADANHPQFVLLLGDLMGHESRDKYKHFSGDKSAAGYQAFARKVFEFLTNEIAAAFPSLDVYTVVGNNDSYQGDYSIKPNGAFFHNTGVLWSGLIREPANQSAMQKQFSYAGYYSLVLPHQLRLIAMNTNLFSYKARGRNIDDAAMRQLSWLHAELQRAKEANQAVFIIMHIPQGIDFYATDHTRLFRLVRLWKPQYIQRFDEELNQFSAEIAGIFAGHLHKNWFQVITENNHDIPVMGVTSISPIFGNDPGFKMISFDEDPVHLDHFSTYTFPINGAPAHLV